jgi:signal transduction histidine kinase
MFSNENDSWLQKVTTSRIQTFIFALLILAGIALELVIHGYYHVSVVYTHFFYLIIVIAGLWYGRRATYIGIFFGVLSIAISYTLGSTIAFDSLLRAGMFCIVGLVVGSIVEQMNGYHRELQKHNKELQDSEAAFLNANRKLNLLSSITRHDINNQLTVLLGYLHLLAETTVEQETQTLLEKTESAAETIQRQITFTRDYQDIGVNAPQWQNPGRCLEAMQSNPNLGSVKMLIRLDSLEVYADPMLEKIYENLIDNALRHGGHVTTITCSYLQSTTGVIIVFEDDGIGIPDEEKEKIFEKGFGKNTGFGLFLSREILGITGLAIRETGMVTRGTRFEITVPFGKFRFSGLGIIPSGETWNPGILNGCRDTDPENSIKSC